MKNDEQITNEAITPESAEINVLEQDARASRVKAYSIRIDESTFRITNPEPKGFELLALVNKDPETHVLNQVIVGEDDIFIDANEGVDLRLPGRERFTVVAKKRHVPQHVHITINNGAFETPKNPMTVGELKTLAAKPLEFNLYQVVHGKSEGHYDNGEVLTLCEGDRFTVNCGEDPS